MKDPYLLQQKYSKNPSTSDGIDLILKKLKELNEKDVYEIGMEFCQNMVYLSDNGINITGGVEFDPTFYQYANKFHKVKDRSWQLNYSYIGHWEPVYHNVYYANNFISLFVNQEIILDILKKNCNILITQDNGDLKVYVNDNSEKLNDSESNSESSKMQDDRSRENGSNQTIKLNKKAK